MPALLTMTSISKSFGATQALRDVTLDVPSGRVLALIGENGAGKSTLMKVLSGAHTPDVGAMTLNDKTFAPSGPHDARLAGVSMIYQELNLAPDLSVEDNIMLGQECHRFGVLDRHAQRLKVRQVLELLGHPDLRSDVTVRELPIAWQQLVEIARALASDSKVIVFDEPTSSLSRADVEHLFAVIRKLKAAGLGIVYISHFLEEIRQVSDDYAVLRDGRAVGSGPLADVTDSQIVSLMVGRSVADLFPSVPHTPGAVVLSVRGLSGIGSPQDVSLELRRGEILGLAGLIGAGRTEFMRCLFGLDEVVSGEVTVCYLPLPLGEGRGEGVKVCDPCGGVDSRTTTHLPLPRDSHQMPSGSLTPTLSQRERGPWHDNSTPQSRIRSGLGLVSEDRKTEGLAQTRSIADNLTYSRLQPYSRFGCLNLGRRRAVVSDWISRLRVKAAAPEQTLGNLSGGNQQKVAIARVLHQEADILLLDEPTRGIDVGTKAEIYRLMGEQAAAGKAIIFVSSYLTELLAVCDRIAVMSRGRLKEIRLAKDWTEEAVMSIAVGV